MRAAAASTPCRVGRPIVISLDSLRRARATALHGNRNDSLSLAIIQGMENRQVFTAECHEPISRLRSPMGTSKPQGCFFVHYPTGGPLTCTALIARWG